MNIITVEDLVKKYNKAEKNAVDNISFSVEEGEFFAFLGPNGAGKTTTISILTTTLSKTSGSVVIAGENLDKNSSKNRRNVGIIFQKPSLDENLTGEENMRFHCILFGLYPFRPTYKLMPDSYKQKVDELTALIGIKDDIFKPVKTYSGGMKRKLEIVRSIMHSPKVLFLDEPTVGLDPESRNNLWDYLGEIRKKHNITIFLTTHYLEEAESADHICIINKGKIVANGTPEKIKSNITSEYILLKANDINQLKSELDSLKYKYISDQDNLKVFINGEDVQNVIKSINTKLSFLDIRRISLEDAYIKIIKDEVNI